MMGPKTPADIRGLEYDWLARDADGHVAIFSTAGDGYAPAEFLRDTDLHDSAIDAILARPPRTEARFAPELPPGRENTWKLMAERGLFAYDSDPEGGPYRLISAPKQPVKMSDLPEVAVGVLAGLVLEHLRFAEMAELSADSLIRAGL